MNTTSGAGSCIHLTYTCYYNLLINACVRYDATNTSTPSKRRNVYAADGAFDHDGIAELHGAEFSPDVYTPSDNYYQVHQAKYGKQPPTPLSGFQKDHHRKPTPSATQKYASPVYVPAEVYKCISPETVASLEKYNTEAINKFTKKRGIHVTDIADHESPPSEDTIHEEQPDPQQFEDAPENEIDPILDYINSQHHQEEDMNNALQAYNVMASPTPADTPQWSISLIHTYLFYHVAQQNRCNMVHLWIGVPMVDLQDLM